MIQYELPEFLVNVITRDLYIKWLDNKKKTHYDRDKEYFGDKFPSNIEPKHYKKAIHNAVILSEGKCFYTGEKLDWKLIQQFGMLDKEGNKRHNKKEFALLPTLDHIDRSKPDCKFAIASWKVNDGKNDLNIKDFLQLCEQVIENKEKILTAEKKRSNLMCYVEV